MSINKRGCEKTQSSFFTAPYFQVTIQNNSQINIPVHRSANNQPNNLHEFTSVTSEKLDILAAEHLPAKECG